MADYDDQVNKETPFTKKKILVIIRICDCLKHFRRVCRRTGISPFELHEAGHPSPSRKISDQLSISRVSEQEFWGSILNGLSGNPRGRLLLPVEGTVTGPAGKCK
jgi:hypothetical protein